MQLVRVPETGVPSGPPDVRPETVPVRPLKLRTPVLFICRVPSPVVLEIPVPVPNVVTTY